MFDIPSVFPQTMDVRHMEILQSMQEVLVGNLVVNDELIFQLERGGVSTVGMKHEEKVC